jgi:hypothetical protein
MLNNYNQNLSRGIYPMEVNGGASVPPATYTTPAPQVTPYTPQAAPFTPQAAPYTPPSYPPMHAIPPIYYTPPLPGTHVMFPGIQTLPPYPVVPMGQLPQHTPQSQPQMVPSGWVDWLIKPLRYW